MFDHLGILIKNANKSLPFYQACLAPLGSGGRKSSRNGALRFSCFPLRADFSGSAPGRPTSCNSV
jgi:hypothetical protein